MGQGSVANNFVDSQHGSVVRGRSHPLGNPSEFLFKIYHLLHKFHISQCTMGAKIRVHPCLKVTWTHALDLLPPCSAKFEWRATPWRFVGSSEATRGIVSACVLPAQRLPRRSTSDPAGTITGLHRTGSKATQPSFFVWRRSMLVSFRTQGLLRTQR